MRNFSFSCIILFLLIFTSSCKSTKVKPKNETPAKCTLPVLDHNITNTCEANFDCVFEFYALSKLKINLYQETITSLDIERGDQFVFKLKRTYRDHPQIADDEFVESIHFSVPVDSRDFYYSGEMLGQSQLIYGKESFSRDRGFHLVDNGCLEGYLNSDNKWVVQMHFKQKLRTGAIVEKTVQATFDEPR